MNGNIVDFYKRYKPDYLIGSDEKLIEQLKTISAIKLEKEITINKSYLLRNIFSTDLPPEIIKIYKLRW